MKSVRRNLDRFPGDFMFELTEHGVIMLAGLLRSELVIAALSAKPSQSSPAPKKIGFK